MHCLTDMFAESVSDMSVANNTSVVAAGTLRFFSLDSIDESICRRYSRLYGRRLAMHTMRSQLTVMVGRTELKTAYAGLGRYEKRWAGHCKVNDHTHSTFMDISF